MTRANGGSLTSLSNFFLLSSQTVVHSTCLVIFLIIGWSFVTLSQRGLPGFFVFCLILCATILRSSMWRATMIFILADTLMMSLVLKPCMVCISSILTGAGSLLPTEMDWGMGILGIKFFHVLSETALTCCFFEGSIQIWPLD